MRPRLSRASERGNRAVTALTLSRPGGVGRYGPGVTSTRHDGDNWDLASSVGTTATMAAMTRAIATRTDPQRLDDPFARPLVAAVGIDLLTRLATGEIPPGELVGPVAIDGAKVRTKFYDDFFLEATRAGVGQVVILASGLDARAYRLSWPAGTTVYEIDRPQVIDFKTRVLADLGASPTADRRTVAVDLRDDWPEALCEAGFDPTQPSAWSAEGLLSYLPPEAQDSLLDSITQLSVPGSRVATESRSPDESGVARALKTISDRWRAHGLDIDMAGVRYLGNRNEAAIYLSALGWTLTVATTRDLLVTSGLQARDDELRMIDLLYVSGQR
jgi:methyltransferase (TIGR00027 family)